MEVGGFPKFSLLKLLVVNCLIREGHYAKVSLGGKQAPTRLQEHVTRNYVRLKHPLVEQESPQGLTDDHIDRFERDLVGGDVFYFPLYHFYHVLETICFYQGASDLGRTTSLTRVDLLCPSLRSKKTQNATAAANVHDDFATEVRRVLQDGFAVFRCTHSVFHHILLIRQLRIVAKVLLNGGMIIRMYTAVTLSVFVLLVGNLRYWLLLVFCSLPCRLII